MHRKRIPRLAAAGSIIRWHFRSPLLIQIFISVAFPPRLLGIGMHFQTTRLPPLLKVPRMELLSSHLWWELGTHLPSPGPGEMIVIQMCHQQTIPILILNTIKVMSSRRVTCNMSTVFLGSLILQLIKTFDTSTFTSDWQQVLPYLNQWVGKNAFRNFHDQIPRKICGRTEDRICDLNHCVFKPRSGHM